MTGQGFGTWFAPAAQRLAGKPLSHKGRGAFRLASQRGYNADSAGLSEENKP